MRPGKEMLLSIPLIFILTSSGVNAQNATEVTETQLTSADCLAYVYVTWIFFVYSIGLGAEERDYPQVLSRAYALVPSQCGGYFTSSPVIPPTTMLSLLITTIQPIQQRDTTWTKLFVGGLPYHTTDKSLREHFEVTILIVVPNVLTTLTIILIKYLEVYGDIEEAVV